MVVFRYELSLPENEIPLLSSHLQLFHSFGFFASKFHRTKKYIRTHLGFKVHVNVKVEKEDKREKVMIQLSFQKQHLKGEKGRRVMLKFSF